MRRTTAFWIALALLAAPLARAANAAGGGVKQHPGTTLLFQFVMNQAGLDTGIAIANTTADPFGTEPEDGTCTWSFFGPNAPAPYTTPNIAAGTVNADTLSARAPGFSGYILADCTFPLAHGYAFISDVGARNLAMSYLALVVPPSKRKTGERLQN